MWTYSVPAEWAYLRGTDTGSIGGQDGKVARRKGELVADGYGMVSYHARKNFCSMIKCFVTLLGQRIRL